MYNNEFRPHYLRFPDYTHDTRTMCEYIIKYNLRKAKQFKRNTN